MSVHRWGLEFLIQLPPITMLLEVLDSPASDIPSLLLS